LKKFHEVSERFGGIKSIHSFHPAEAIVIGHSEPIPEDFKNYIRGMAAPLEVVFKLAPPIVLETGSNE